jgi:hypothetical protein
MQHAAQHSQRAPPTRRRRCWERCAQAGERVCVRRWGLAALASGGGAPPPAASSASALRPRSAPSAHCVATRAGMRMRDMPPPLPPTPAFSRRYRRERRCTRYRGPCYAPMRCQSLGHRHRQRHRQRPRRCSDSSCHRRVCARSASGRGEGMGECQQIGEERRRVRSRGSTVSACWKGSLRSHAGGPPCAPRNACAARRIAACSARCCRTPSRRAQAGDEAVPLPPSTPPSFVRTSCNASSSSTKSKTLGASERGSGCERGVGRRGERRALGARCARTRGGRGPPCAPPRTARALRAEHAPNYPRRG